MHFLKHASDKMGLNDVIVKYILQRGGPVISALLFLRYQRRLHRFWRVHVQQHRNSAPTLFVDTRS